MRYVVVGGGVAGVCCAEELCRLLDDDDAEEVPPTSSGSGNRGDGGGRGSSVVLLSADPALKASCGLHTTLPPLDACVVQTSRAAGECGFRSSASLAAAIAAPHLLAPPRPCPAPPRPAPPCPAQSVSVVSRLSRHLEELALVERRQAPAPLPHPSLPLEGAAGGKGGAAAAPPEQQQQQQRLRVVLGVAAGIDLQRQVSVCWRGGGGGRRG